MNKTGIGVCSLSRLSSTRCKRKMIRPFADTTLTDIILSKLSILKYDVFFGGYEDIFKIKCQTHNVPFIKRTKQSALVDEPASIIYEFFTKVPHEYILLINACIPFLKTQSIVNFLNICKKNNKPKFAVFKKNNYYMSVMGEKYNFNDTLTTINTKNVSPVYEFAHVFYYFKKSYFEETGWYWDWNEVEYIEIDEGMETFDIDTEEQFIMAEAFWKHTGHMVI